MRLEATVPDTRGEAVDELAEKLGLSRSQVVDEALALFLKAVLEAKRGRRLGTFAPGNSEPACELASPTLSAIEWAAHPVRLVISPEALLDLARQAEAAPVPNARLKAAFRRHQR